jgi:methyl-accepting chemotaxis protein/nitric oxide dioxygenase
MAMHTTSDALDRVPLDTGLVARLRASYELVRGHELRLAETFYIKLFALAPHLRRMFPADLRGQAEKLTAALDMVVRNFEDPAANAAALAALGRRHAGYGVKAEHYTLVVDLLVESMRELGGAAIDEARIEEWHAALRLISQQMIAATRAP